MGAGWCGLFPDQLMVRDVVHKPDKPSLAGGFVWNVNVGCFTILVLGIGYTADSFVKGGATEATADDDRAVEVFAQGFEDVDAELLQVADNVERWRIVNVTR